VRWWRGGQWKEGGGREVRGRGREVKAEGEGGYVTRGLGMMGHPLE
jgi:hypothetical protein